MASVYLILGSNLGNRLHFLQQAKQQLTEKAGRIISQSSLYETEPWGFNHDNQFINQVIILQTQLLPADLLTEIKNIEKLLGREKGKERYTARTIDIDILFYDNLIVNTPQLTIPHAEIPNRRFVLEPLCEIDGEFFHPCFKKPIKELLSECSDSNIVIKLLPYQEN